MTAARNPLAAHLVSLSVVAACALTGRAAPFAGAERDGLAVLLSMLARRAALYETLLYRLDCEEDLTLSTYLVDEKGRASKTVERTVRSLVVIEKAGTRLPREVRLAIDRDGRVRSDSQGPIENKLPADFQPVAKAFPHAQVSWFTSERQRGLRFRILGATERRGERWRIECPTPREVALEFLAKEPPRSVAPEWGEPRCEARASGQVCVDPESGEILAIEYYGTRLTLSGDCDWDLKRPFARITLEIVEPKSGIHFPSRVETIVPREGSLDVFTQRFRGYAFANVQAEEKLGGVVTPTQ